MIIHVYCLVYSKCDIIHIIINHNKEITNGYIKYAIKKCGLDVSECFYVSSNNSLPIEDTRAVIKISSSNNKN